MWIFGETMNGNLGQSCNKEAFWGARRYIRQRLVRHFISVEFDRRVRNFKFKKCQKLWLYCHCDWVVPRRKLAKARDTYRNTELARAYCMLNVRRAPHHRTDEQRSTTTGVLIWFVGRSTHGGTRWNSTHVKLRGRIWGEIRMLPVVYRHQFDVSQQLAELSYKDRSLSRSLLEQTRSTGVLSKLV